MQQHWPSYCQVLVFLSCPTHRSNAIAGHNPQRSRSISRSRARTHTHAHARAREHTHTHTHQNSDAPNSRSLSYLSCVRSGVIATLRRHTFCCISEYHCPFDSAASCNINRVFESPSSLRALRDLLFFSISFSFPFFKKFKSARLKTVRRGSKRLKLRS